MSVPYERRTLVIPTGGTCSRSADRHLQWSRPQDHELWQSIKDATGLCLYYWLPEFWLKKSPA